MIQSRAPGATELIHTELYLKYSGDYFQTLLNTPEGKSEVARINQIETTII